MVHILTSRITKVSQNPGLLTSVMFSNRCADVKRYTRRK